MPRQNQSDGLDQETREKLAKSAQSAYHRGHYRHCIRILDDILSNEPSLIQAGYNSPAFFYRGLANHQLGNIETAVEDYSRGIQREGKGTPVKRGWEQEFLALLYIERAALRNQLNQSALAIRDLGFVVEFGDRIDYNVVMATAMATLNEKKEAVNYFKRAIQYADRSLDGKEQPKEDLKSDYYGRHIIFKRDYVFAALAERGLKNLGIKSRTNFEISGIRRKFIKRKGIEQRLEQVRSG